MSHSSEPSPERIIETLFKPSGVGGVYGRTETFEQVVEGLHRLISRHRPPKAEVLRFPPLMSRIQLERSGYLQSFPHFVGSVGCLQGDEVTVRALIAKADWSDHVVSTDLVLSPAACYPTYSLAAARGAIPASGLVFDVASYCFRREATHELGRFQSFQMREYVCFGLPAQILDFRQRWIGIGESIAYELGLDHKIARASDPFFGRAGSLAAQSQLDQELKFELLIPVRSELDPTACMSFNYHLDHFSTAWGLISETGETVHTGCVAFGIDRLALALFFEHGFNPKEWATSIRTSLAI